MRHTGKLVAILIMIVRMIGWSIYLEVTYHLIADFWYLLFIPETAVALVLGHMYDRSRFFSQNDTLTGVYNRRFIHAVLPRLMAKADRTGKKLSVFMVDLNDLKQINDDFGHKAGDITIQHVANLLVSDTRKCDFIARWGGDEFLILAPDTDESGAHTVCQRIKNNMIAVGISETMHLKPSVSVGAAVYPDEGKSLDTLMRIADARMYDDKEAYTG